MYAASIMSMRNDGRFFQAVPCINLGHRPFEEWVLEMCIKNINAASTVIPGVEKKGIIYYAATNATAECIGNLDARLALNPRRREDAIKSICANIR